MLNDLGGSFNNTILSPAGASVAASNLTINAAGGDTTVAVLTSALWNSVKSVTLNSGASSNLVGGGDVIFTDAPTVTVSGAGVRGVAVSDLNNNNVSAAKLTSVTLNNLGGTATLTGDALVTVNVNSTTAQAVNVINTTAVSASAPRTITYNLNGAGKSGAVVTLNDSTGAGAGAVAASTVALNATGSNDVVVANGAATTLTIGGTGSLILGAASIFGTLTTINASQNSGGVTITDNTANATVTGGSGNDVITLTTALTGGTINLGAGNNTLLAGTGGSLGTTATVDGGTGGTNTISATLVNAGDAANIKDFQILDISGFGSLAGNGALDASLMSTVVTGVSISSAMTDGVATLLNLGSAVTVNDTTTGTNSGITLTHSAGTGTLAVNFDNTAQLSQAITTLTSTGDSSVTFSTGGNVTSALVSNLIETDNHLTTVTITGAHLFGLDAVHTDSMLAAGTATVASSLTTIDASATTGGVYIAAGTSDTFNGNTITYTGLTIKGGTGGDTIINHAANGVITEGATASTLVNVLVVTGSGATINDAASAGNDVISLYGANDAATLGSGASTVNVSSNPATSDVVTVNLVSGAGATVTDSLLYASAAGNQTASTTYDLVTLGGTALHANNLAFSAQIATPAGALGAATSVASAQTFDQAVFVALGGTMGGAASTTTTHAINTVDWFQYAGNTYIVDAGGTAPGTGAAATAEVVKVVGVVDLSHATIATGGAHITFA